MTSITIVLDNENSKLSQKKWSDYISAIHRAVIEYSVLCHFVGGTAFDAVQQRACFVCEISQHLLQEFFTHLERIRKHYKQEQIRIFESLTKDM
jgi:hypothetical protein